MKNRKMVRRLATVCASLALIVVCGTGAYAANVGGIQHKMNVWLHGDMTEVTIEQVADGQFEITYPDGTVRGTGGIAIGRNGEERSETLEEVEDRLLNEPEVMQKEDGRIYLYLRDHKIDITDQIDEKGYAQEKIKDGVLADYITVVWNGDGSYSMNTGHHGFGDPQELIESTRN